MSELRTSAIAALRAVVATKTASDLARERLVDIWGDGCRDFHAIPNAIETALVSLIDAVLNADGLAEYFLYEALSMKDGGSISFNDDGRSYPIRTIEDVEILLRERYPEPPK